MITPDQLDELRSIFEGYDDDALLSKISVSPTVNRGIVISIAQIGWQEFAAIFPGVEPWALKGDPA